MTFNSTQVMTISFAAAFALAGIGVIATLPRQQSAETIKIENETNARLTEKSYTVLFNRHGCEVAKYTPYYNGDKYYNGGKHQGRDVNVIICPPGGGAETSQPVSCGKLCTRDEIVTSGDASQITQQVRQAAIQARK